MVTSRRLFCCGFKLVSFQPTVEGTDDRTDWEEVLEAMDAVSLNEDEKYELICTTAAVLHLGNIEFTEASTEVAEPESRECE